MKTVENEMFFAVFLFYFQAFFEPQSNLMTSDFR